MHPGLAAASILAVTLLAITLDPGVVRSLTVEPHTVLGKWVGHQTEQSKVRGSRDPRSYSLTITNVAGDRVERTRETGRGEGKFTGTLTGNQLTFGTNSITQLSIDGDTMAGERRPAAGAGYPFRIELKKVKE